MSEHPLQSFFQTVKDNLNDMVNVNTTIGEPVVVSDGTMVIPVCKVSYGFAAGGRELEKHNQESVRVMPSFGGGMGGGASVTPLAIIIIGKMGVQTIYLDNSPTVYDRILDIAPHLLDQLHNLIKRYHTGDDNSQ
ncbi:putative spore protein YtfJ [Paenibacillus polymyxa E681]|nr:GerW family sporulation protein [Paenibacillus polymyxa]ADM70040.1 sporulation protein [Paenibacillus polymyxa E681]QNV57065.1 putative spore protein YtfJ [Paenibacillus polymyxa E681]QNV61902.1 putative spore protein YtfJ [Paenibacillus polymyxa E681]